MHREVKFNRFNDESCFIGLPSEVKERIYFVKMFSFILKELLLVSIVYLLDMKQRKYSLMDVALCNHSGISIFFYHNNRLITKPDAFHSLNQWFSTGVPRNPRVPQKAVWVPPISKFNWYLLVNCS